MIKLVASDLDGTLLNKDHQLCCFSQGVIKKLIDTGVFFVIATGRHYQDIEHLLTALGGNIYSITCNGAMVYSNSGRIIHTQFLNTLLVKQLLNIAERFQVHQSFYSPDAWLVEEDKKSLLINHQQSKFVYQVVNDLKEETSSVLKVMFYGENNELIKLQTEIKQSLQAQVSITFSDENRLEVMALGTNKASGLHNVLKKIKIQASQVMAFGDNLNDTEMLQLSAHKIVMKNAHPELASQLSDYTTADNHRGVAKYIESYFQL